MTRKVKQYTVSVLVLSYNRPKMLRETLSSIKGADEVIIVDDGSDFDIVSVIKKYKFPQFSLIGAPRITVEERLKKQRIADLINEALKKARGDIITYLCVVPDTLVETEDGVKEIQAIRSGDRVLSKDGVYRVVNKVLKRRIDEEIISITPYYSNIPIICTKNHRFPIYNSKEVLLKRADEIVVSDWLLIPKEKIKQGKIFDLKNILNYRFDDERIYTQKGTWVRRHIVLDDNFYRLLGYFTAEGSCNKNYGIFYFNRNEREFIEDVHYLIKEVFGCESVTEYHRDSVTSVQINSTLIAQALSYMVGNKKAFEKYIRKDFLPSDNIQIKSFLLGLFRGDGCVIVDEKRRGVRLTTSSIKLALQVRRMFLGMGLPAALYRWKRNEEYIKGRKLNGKDWYEIRCNRVENLDFIENDQSRNDKKNLVRDLGEYWGIRVRSISSMPYTGDVYTMSVDGIKYYNVGGIITKNCDDDLMTEEWIPTLKKFFAEHGEKYHFVRGNCLRFVDKNDLSIKERSQHLMVFGDSPRQLITGNFAHLRKCFKKEKIKWPGGFLVGHDTTFFNEVDKVHDTWTVPLIPVNAVFRRIHDKMLSNHVFYNDDQSVSLGEFSESAKDMIRKNQFME